MIKTGKGTIIICTCILLFAVVSNSVYSRNLKEIGRSISKDTAGRAPAPEKGLLDTFDALCKKLGDTKGNYTLAGIINITDRANPKADMKNIAFLMCKQGDDFYYKLGTTVTLNEQGVYIYIDQQNKSILLSAKKQLAYDDGLKKFGDLGASIKSENYRMVSKVNGDEETLSLINEHHISCKQYSITFKRQNLKIKRLYMRLSDPRDPLRTDNENIIEVNITQWDHTADISKYLTKNSVVRNVKGRWETMSAFKNYRLTEM